MPALLIPVSLARPISQMKHLPVRLLSLLNMTSGSIQKMRERMTETGMVRLVKKRETRSSVLVLSVWRTVFVDVLLVYLNAYMIRRFATAKFEYRVNDKMGHWCRLRRAMM
jgi:hypothetical protein